MHNNVADLGRTLKNVKKILEKSLEIFVKWTALTDFVHVQYEIHINIYNFYIHLQKCFRSRQHTIRGNIIRTQQDIVWEFVSFGFKIS